MGSFDLRTISIAVVIALLIGAGAGYMVGNSPVSSLIEEKDWLEAEYDSLYLAFQSLEVELDSTQELLVEEQRDNEYLQERYVEMLALDRENQLLHQQVIDLESEITSLQNAYQDIEDEYEELQENYVRAEDEPIPPFTVRGKYVYDNFGRRVTIKGFALDSGRFAPGYRPDEQSFVKEDIQRIKDWGFHFVYSQIWWGWVEPYQTQTGVYDYPNMLDRYHHVIDWCDEVNLNWIFRFRVSFEDDLSGSDDAWWGWPTARYVCTEEGLERYCDFLKDTITVLESEHDNIVAYQPWQFPFHRTPLTEEEETFYYERVIPEMTNAVRSVTSKPIINSYLLLGWRGFFKDFDDRFKVEDTNVIYSIDYYHPVNHGTLTVEDQSVWEGTSSNIEEQWDLLRPAVDFSNKYDVPLNVLEFGIMMERQDQLDKLRLKLELLDYYGIGWCYWWYSWYRDPAPAFIVLNADRTPIQGIVNLLIAYNNWR